MENQFSLNLINIYGVRTDDRKKKLTASIVAAEIAVNSEEFKLMFMAAKFTQLTDKQLSMSRQQLYEMVLKAASFDYYVQNRSIWKRFSSVMGWEDTQGVHTYTDVYDGLSTGGLSGHLTHEGSHALGFEHSAQWCPERDTSIPYVVGNWVEAYVNARRAAT